MDAEQPHASAVLGGFIAVAIFAGITGFVLGQIF